VGIFKRSANPVPHEFYISLGGLLRNLKFFGKKFRIGMFITLDLLVEPIISFVSKFSSHDFYRGQNRQRYALEQLLGTTQSCGYSY